jgi:hypothetical protein
VAKAKIGFHGRKQRPSKLPGNKMHKENGSQQNHMAQRSIESRRRPFDLIGSLADGFRFCASYVPFSSLNPESLPATRSVSYL